MAFSPSANDYREFAFKCMQAAEKTRDPRRRRTMIDMAKLWIQTALELEQSFALLDDDGAANQDLKS